MTPSDLSAMADRLEAADASETRALLEEAWRKLRGDEYAHTGFNHFYRFQALLDAEAYVDAALMLVPEGWGARLFFSEDRPDRELHCSATLARSYPTNAEVYAEKSGKNGDRSALALALAAASIRARQNNGR